MDDSPTDQQLLRDYSQSGDERAFRCLANRYSGLIYHTALRVSNNRTLAEDVSQRVLGALAKKSPDILRSGVPLAAWLHRSTILETKSMRRSEARHHRKKEALMLEPTDHSQSKRDTSWQDALPQLDAAIDSLPETDRRVLLLHYIDGMTFPEVARRLNKSAAAVQKQSRRALNRLQKLLGKRGLTLSIGILAAGLTAEMAKAAPVTLITSLSTVQTFNTTTQILAVKKTTIAAIGITALLCGAPLAKQHLAIRNLEKQISETRSTAFQPPPRSRPGIQQSDSNFLRDLAKALAEQNENVPDYIEALSYIESLSNEELIRLPIDGLDGNLKDSEQAVLLRFAISTLGNRNQELALNVLLEQVPKSFFSGNFDCGGLLIGGIRNFGKSEPHAALAWFESKLDAILALPRRENFPEDWLETNLRGALSYGFVHDDPETAAEVLRPVASDFLLNHLGQICRSNSPQLHKNPEGLIQVSRSLLPEDQSNEIVARIASSMIDIGRNGHISYERQETLLDRDDLTTGERDTIALWAGLSSIGVNLRKSPTDNLMHYRKWLQDLGYQDADRRLGEMMALKAEKWSASRESIFSILTDREAPGFSDQTVVCFLHEITTNGTIRNEDFESLNKLPQHADDPEVIQTIVDQIKNQHSR